MFETTSRLIEKPRCGGLPRNRPTLINDPSSEGRPIFHLAFPDLLYIHAVRCEGLRVPIAGCRLVSTVKRSCSMRTSVWRISARLGESSLIE